MAKKWDLGSFFYSFHHFWVIFSLFRAEGRFLFFFCQFLPFWDFGPFVHSIPGGLTHNTGNAGTFGWHVYIGIFVRENVSSKRHVNHKHVDKGVNGLSMSCFTRRIVQWKAKWWHQASEGAREMRQALSGPLRLRVQSRSRTRLRIVASIAFLFRAYFKGVLDTIAPLSRGWAP